MTVWFLLSLQLMGPSFLWLYLPMILLFMTPQTPLPQTPRTPLLKTPRTQPPRMPRKFSFLFLFIFYFFYPLLFPNSSKCPCFWALFVNTFYLWHLFNILHSSLLVFFAMCWSLLWDMRISIHFCAYMLGLTHLLWCTCPPINITWIRPLNNELVHLDLIMNSFTCGLNNFKAS